VSSNLTPSASYQAFLRLFWPCRDYPLIFPLIVRWIGMDGSQRRQRPISNNRRRSHQRTPRCSALSLPCQKVPHGGMMPFATPRRANASRVQRLGNRPLLLRQKPQFLPLSAPFCDFSLIYLLFVARGSCERGRMLSRYAAVPACPSPVKDASFRCPWHCPPLGKRAHRHLFKQVPPIGVGRPRYRLAFYPSITPDASILGASKI
jgi:hypothetical protein